METVWLLVVVGGPILLFLALAYGVIQYRTRNRSMDAVSDRGARKLRRDLERDEQRGRV